MPQHLKERLVGAAVLILIAVIFIPIFLTGPVDDKSITKTNIPERQIRKFDSKIIPIIKDVSPGTQINDGFELLEKLPIPDNKKNVKSRLEAELISTEESSFKKLKSDKIVKDKQVGQASWVVQIGTFSSKDNADKLIIRLRKLDFTAFVQPLEENNEVVYRVRVGPELLRTDADALLKKIKENTKLDGMVLNYP
ncbi:MAG: hypothetical protein CMF45_09695 [Legionellales bacterium]|nr:hypothetical protein [Legionellales bacterium]|tara:strand:+ start:958 stop:1542 length:585 start_codon:yes stop_codon:yes gene_type:complete